jgi:AcrR family transcriptional regulator
MARKVNLDSQKAAIAVLLDAGINAIAHDGIDQISVQRVTQEANTSRPTFYSYFGDINGLLAEIWLAHSTQWLEDLANYDLDIPSLKSSKKLVHRAMCEILAASHRIPEVDELVQPSMRIWWTELSESSPMHQLKTIWLIGERLGATLTDPVDPKVHSARFVESALRAISDEQIKKPLPKLKVLPRVSEPAVIDESLESRLLKSAIEVISAGGVKSASMARVARKTQVSTGAVYPRYAKVDDLIESSFEIAITKVVEQNFELLKSQNFSPDDFGAFVMAGLTENRKIWRNFRFEIHLGARSRPQLARRIAQNLKETNDSVATRISIYELPDLVSGPIPYLIHCIGIGLAMLQSAGVPVNELDHRAISRALVQSFSS